MKTINQNPIESFIHENYEFKAGTTGFAKESGVTYQTVHKTILGLYRAIPTKLADALARDSDWTVDKWQNEYRLWVERELNILITDIARGNLECEALFVPIGELSSHYADFTAWREALSYSQIDFCKTFLVHQAILNKYENGEMKSFPNILKERISFIMNGLMGQGIKSAELYALAVSNLPIRKK